MKNERKSLIRKLSHATLLCFGFVNCRGFDFKVGFCLTGKSMMTTPTELDVQEHILVLKLLSDLAFQKRTRTKRIWQNRERRKEKTKCFQKTITQKTPETEFGPLKTNKQQNIKN